MKLYTYPGAPNPRRVEMYLAEKGLPVPTVTVDIVKRENRQPPYLALNPVGGVPVLELDDGTTIAESVAICRYFEALHPEPPLFGTTPVEQAQIEMWSRRVELNGMRTIGMVWIHGSPFTKAVNPNQIPEVADQNRKLAHQFYAFLDESLGDRSWLAGETFTIADILALTTIDFASGLVELPYDPALANLAAWHERASARPSAKAGLPQN